MKESKVKRALVQTVEKFMGTATESDPAVGVVPPAKAKAARIQRVSSVLCEAKIGGKRGVESKAARS